MLCPLSSPSVCLRVLFIEWAVHQRAEGNDDLCFVQSHGREAVQTQSGHFVVQPLGSLQIPLQNLHELALGVHIHPSILIKDD